MNILMDTMTTMATSVLSSSVEPWWAQYVWMLFAAIALPPLAAWYKRQSETTKRIVDVGTAAFNHTEKLAVIAPQHAEHFEKADMFLEKAIDMWHQETGKEPSQSVQSQLKGVAESLVKEQNLAKIAGSLYDKLKK